MSRALVVIKPDGVERNLIGTIIKKLERYVSIVDIDMTKKDKDFWKIHYIEHENSDNYEKLCGKLANRKVIALLVESNHDKCYRICRQVLKEIRREYATSRYDNVIHASDSSYASKREIELWFV